LSSHSLFIINSQFVKIRLHQPPVSHTPVPLQEQRLSKTRKLQMDEMLILPRNEHSMVKQFSLQEEGRCLHAYICFCTTFLLIDCLKITRISQKNCANLNHEQISITHTYTHTHAKYSTWKCFQGKS
jgi:hypothetical protein